MSTQNTTFENHDDSPPPPETRARFMADLLGLDAGEDHIDCGPLGAVLVGIARDHGEGMLSADQDLHDAIEMFGPGVFMAAQILVDFVCERFPDNAVAVSRE